MDRKHFAQALAAVAPAVPARSPKPTLRNVLVRADDGGTTLTATDLEVAIRAQAIGVAVGSPGAMLLPADRLAQICKSCPDATLAIEAAGDGARVLAARAKFDLPTEDPAGFPEVEFADLHAAYSAAAGGLRDAIRRVAHAADVEGGTARYALSGLCLSLDAPGTLGVVATDGRRLAKHAVPCAAEGGAAWPDADPVVPSRAMRLAERLLAAEEEAQPVHFLADRTAFYLAIPGRAEIRSRLVDGRYPRYHDVLPATHSAVVGTTAGEWLAAVQQAAIATGDESRGVDFAFRDGVATLAARAADVGASAVELPVAYDGDPVEVTLDARYLQDPFSPLDPATPVRFELVDAKTPVVFRVDGGYFGCIMPLTRDR